MRGVGTLRAASEENTLGYNLTLSRKGLDISIELGRPKMDVEITDFPSEKKYL